LIPHYTLFQKGWRSADAASDFTLNENTYRAKRQIDSLNSLNELADVQLDFDIQRFDCTSEVHALTRKLALPNKSLMAGNQDSPPG